MTHICRCRPTINSFPPSLSAALHEFNACKVIWRLRLMPWICTDKLACRNREIWLHWKWIPHVLVFVPFLSICRLQDNFLLVESRLDTKFLPQRLMTPCILDISNKTPFSSSKKSIPIGSMYGIYIWVNYNISPTWIKAIWGWFPLLTMIPVRSQWGRYNLPRYMLTQRGYIDGIHVTIYSSTVRIRHGIAAPPNGSFFRTAKGWLRWAPRAVFTLRAMNLEIFRVCKYVTYEYESIGMYMYIWIYVCICICI